jgi:1-acyl-sn-glycerol-3-phosphate acyltransferase
VKQSLLEYPVFRHVMRSRDPIAVNRTNPREDLKTVFEGGVERLRKGIALIVFPQTTRTPTFDPAQFNTIGVKLAQKAQVPVVPLALLTDAWGNGKYLKDFGKIDLAKKVYFAFGQPMAIHGRGNPEHEAIIAFITGKLREWRA